MDLCQCFETTGSSPEKGARVTKGRRDIRFFPESEAKLLDLTEEENMETVFGL